MYLWGLVSFSTNQIWPWICFVFVFSYNRRFYLLFLQKAAYPGSSRQLLDQGTGQRDLNSLPWINGFQLFTFGPHF